VPNNRDAHSIDGRDTQRVVLGVGVLCCEVRQVKDLPAAGKPRETRFGIRKDRFIPYFRVGGGALCNTTARNFWS
jgi:hypothetical protein